MRYVHWAALWALVLDQASKLYMQFVLELEAVNSVVFLPGFVTFRWAWNHGINFGLFGGMDARWILIGLGLVISGGVYVWIRRENPGRLEAISAGMLIGGALGNVIDRIAFGAVVDFLNVTCCGIRNPYSFNIADIFIFAGAIGLILFTGEKKAG